MKNTILSLQKKTSIAEVSVTANYLEQFLSTRLKLLQDLTRYSMVADAVMRTDVANRGAKIQTSEFLSEYARASLSDFLDRYQFLGQKERMKILTSQGVEVYSSFEMSDGRDDKISQEKWFQAVISGTMESSVLLVRNQEKSFFQIAVPFKYEGRIEGILITQFYSDISELFKSIAGHRETAIKLRGNWGDKYVSVKNLDDSYTLVQKRAIRNVAMSLEYYVHQKFLDKQAREFMHGVTLSVFLSVFLSFLMLSFLGKKLFLNPFEMLAGSEKELRQSQEELEIAKAKAEQANVAKGSFLANMSHELRTPMNAIMGLADILMESKLSADDKESVTTIYNSSGQMLYLLNDLLDFSKIEQGEIEIEYMDFDLSYELTALERLFSAVADKKKLVLSFDITGDLPSHFNGGINHIRQILHNLIGNALKFTDQGRVTIEVFRPSAQDIEMVRFCVTDTGIGIGEDEAHKVFEKFSQADASISRRFGGTGLGLSISKKLAEKMGGTVAYESKKGEGSRFWLDVPLKEISKEDVERLSSNKDGSQELSGDAFKDARLLVVDDHPTNLLFMRKLLKKMGVDDFIEASSGEEALEIMKAQEFDVVLMDCHLPEISGMEATRRLRAFEKEQGRGELPVVAVTADVLEDTKNKCFKAGMKYYLTKPITKANLYKILSEIFDDSSPERKDLNAKEQNKEINMNEQNPPVDLDHLREFTDGDPEEEKEFFEIYLSQSEIIISALESSLEDKDSWKEAAHKLMGASANLGANDLANLCKQAENEYKADRDVKQALLNEIKSELARVEAFIQSLHD